MVYNCGPGSPRGSAWAVKWTLSVKEQVTGVLMLLPGTRPAVGHSPGGPQYAVLRPAATGRLSAMLHVVGIDVQLPTLLCPPLLCPPCSAHPSAVYDGGNLHEFVQRLRQESQQHQQHQRQHGAAGGAAAAAAQQARREAQREHLRTLLHIFLQVCAALHAMHIQEPPLAHRDVKPLNVLLRSRQAAANGGSQEAGQQQGQQQWRQQVGSYDPVPPIEPLPSSREAGGGWEAGGWEDGGGSTAAAGAAGAANNGTAAVIAVQQEGEQHRQARHHRHASWDADRGRLPDAWWQRRLPQWRQQHEAVLMDFGSARPMPIAVRSRSQAMAAQEDAEVSAGGFCRLLL